MSFFPPVASIGAKFDYPDTMPRLLDQWNPAITSGILHPGFHGWWTSDPTVYAELPTKLHVRLPARPSVQVRLDLMCSSNVGWKYDLGGGEVSVASGPKVITLTFPKDQWASIAMSLTIAAAGTFTCVLDRVHQAGVQRFVKGYRLPLNADGSGMSQGLPIANAIVIPVVPIGANKVIFPDVQNPTTVRAGHAVDLTFYNAVVIPSLTMVALTFTCGTFAPVTKTFMPLAPPRTPLTFTLTAPRELDQIVLSLNLNTAWCVFVMYPCPCCCRRFRRESDVSFHACPFTPARRGISGCWQPARKRDETRRDNTTQHGGTTTVRHGNNKERSTALEQAESTMRARCTTHCERVTPCEHAPLSLCGFASMDVLRMGCDVSGVLLLRFSCSSSISSALRLLRPMWLMSSRPVRFLDARYSGVILVQYTCRAVRSTPLLPPPSKSTRSTSPPSSPSEVSLHAPPHARHTRCRALSLLRSSLVRSSSRSSSALCPVSSVLRPCRS
jgi:hypothetical protein